MKIGLIGIVGVEAKEDFWGTMERVAAIGYQGIEGAEHSLLNGDVTENLKRFNGLGLELLTTSASREDLRDTFDAVRERAIAVKTPRVSIWWSPANNRDELMRECELYNTAGAKLMEDGIKLCYHNHDQEFRNTFDGVDAMSILAMHTDPKSVFFTIDVGWVAVGGEDPLRVLHRLKGRVPAIHAKDFADTSDRNSFTAVGTGVAPIVEAMKIAPDCGVEWAIVEQDRLRNLSAFDTVMLSYLYLKESGVAD